MLNTKTIGFIGGGNMAEAMLQAILNRQLILPEQVIISDISDKRRSYIAQHYRVHSTSDNLHLVREADVVILAVKPHDLPEVMAIASQGATPGKLFISIVAGATIDRLRAGLKAEQVIRAMPNTPAQVGEGLTVWTSTPQVTPGQLEIAREILASFGKEIYVQDENYLDGATAISGSGPAYIFLVMEALIEAAQRIGLPLDMAKEMVLQTVIGAGVYARIMGLPLDELRRRVTSAGGTTEAAIRVLQQGNLETLIGEAVVAAYRRAKEIGLNTDIKGEPK